MFQAALEAARTIEDERMKTQGKIRINAGFEREDYTSSVGHSHKLFTESVGTRLNKVCSLFPLFSFKVTDL